MNKAITWAVVAGVLGVGLLAVWWLIPRPESPLKRDITAIDTLLQAKVESDRRVDALTSQIGQLRVEAAQRERAAVERSARADTIARESVQLRARVQQLEDSWQTFRAPQTLPEARRQLTTAAELVVAYKTELQAKDSEIGELRQAIQELTAGAHAKDIALAKSEAREELRKEMLDRFQGELERIRQDLKEERQQRARERWMALVPIVGAVLLLFGGTFVGG